MNLLLAISPWQRRNAGIALLSASPQTSHALGQGDASEYEGNEEVMHRDHQVRPRHLPDQSPNEEQPPEQPPNPSPADSSRVDDLAGGAQLSDALDDIQGKPLHAAIAAKVEGHDEHPQVSRCFGSGT